MITFVNDISATFQSSTSCSFSDLIPLIILYFSKLPWICPNSHVDTKLFSSAMYSSNVPVSCWFFWNHFFSKNQTEKLWKSFLTVLSSSFASSTTFALLSHYIVHPLHSPIKMRGRNCISILQFLSHGCGHLEPCSTFIYSMLLVQWNQFILALDTDFPSCLFLLETICIRFSFLVTDNSHNSIGRGDHYSTEAFTCTFVSFQVPCSNRYNSEQRCLFTKIVYTKIDLIWI